jgi:hypothetical protein
MAMSTTGGITSTCSDWCDGSTVYIGGLETHNAGRYRFTGEHQFFKAKFSGTVDGMALLLDNDDCEHLTMDNIQFRANPPAAPEPGAASLLVLSLAGLAATARRRGKRR